MLRKYCLCCIYDRRQKNRHLPSCCRALSRYKQLFCTILNGGLLRDLYNNLFTIRFYKTVKNFLLNRGHNFERQKPTLILSISIHILVLKFERTQQRQQLAMHLNPLPKYQYLYQLGILNHLEKKFALFQLLLPQRQRLQ